VFECPDYTNHGYCEAREKVHCPLPHVDRASTLRKAAKRQGQDGSGDASDVSSDDHEQQDDPNDDESDVDIVMGSDNDHHGVSQQRDFIAFS
jgi:hypothetical protein